MAAGDRLSNALLGNVTSTSDPTGKTLANTGTGGSATAAAATTFGASGAGTVTVRFQGAGLASPVDISLAVIAGTTIEAALTSLTSAVAANSSLQAAGITATTAAAGSALVFTSNRGERFEVQASGDLNNRLGLGSFRSSGGASGTFDYSVVTSSGATYAAAAQTLEFSVGGGDPSGGANGTQRRIRGERYTGGSGFSCDGQWRRNRYHQFERHQIPAQYSWRGERVRL